MCKPSINNVLLVTLMSIVQNKHLPMLKSGRYAVRHSQRFCSLCQELYHSVFFSFFLPLPVLKTTHFRAISKQIMDIFLQILDGNGLDDTKGRLLYRNGQKCIEIQYLFRVNRGLPVYCCTPKSNQHSLLQFS